MKNMQDFNQWSWVGEACRKVELHEQIYGGKIQYKGTYILDVFQYFHSYFITYMCQSLKT